ncbi:MAG: UTRA domain-containing protein [Defluviimonas denitrificans]
MRISAKRCAKGAGPTASRFSTAPSAPPDPTIWPCFLGIEAGQRIIALDYVHHADSDPFCHERRIINLTSVPLAEEADFAEEPAGTWLLRQVPWSSAEHLIRAVVAPPAVARLLGIAPATPCLEITRRTEFEGRPITFACLTYPGSKHQLAARFSPQDGSANL